MGTCFGKEKSPVQFFPASSKAKEETGSNDKAVDESQEIVNADFFQDYCIGKQLGKGNFSVVYLATRLRDEERNNVTGQKKEYAVKKLNDASLSDADRKALFNEISILQSLSHENIIEFYDFYNHKPDYFIVTEYVNGGELFDKIVEKEYYMENDAYKVIKTVAEALNYIHIKGIAHRDLKPENILLQKKQVAPGETNEDDYIIKLADFGFAKSMQMGDGLVTSLGTPGYVAPEILKGNQYGMECDNWSLGVIFYILLCGFPPFRDDGKGQLSLFRKIKTGDFAFEPAVYWASVSDYSKDLVRGLLTVDASKRTPIVTLIENLTKVLEKSGEEKKLDKALAELKSFQAKKKWKAGINAVTAANRMSSLVEKDAKPK
eukprot:maker-scaffold_9-snap-gene-11.12-mRNA-1 protein AED:0.06 eAED:0.06 QI:181/1/1/1/1/1/2/77/375